MYARSLRTRVGAFGSLRRFVGYIQNISRKTRVPTVKVNRTVSGDQYRALRLKTNPCTWNNTTENCSTNLPKELRNAQNRNPLYQATHLSVWEVEHLHTVRIRGMPRGDLSIVVLDSAVRVRVLHIPVGEENAHLPAGVNLHQFQDSVKVRFTDLTV